MTAQEVAAKALTDFWLKATSPFASRMDEAAAILEALQAAGWKLVKTPGTAADFSSCCGQVYGGDDE